MSLTEILFRKDADPQDQLKEVAGIVGAARQAYGNSDAEIAAPMCDTSEGRMSFVHLSAEGKVAILRKQIGLVKAAAVEFVENNPGAEMTRKIEELLSLNGYFCNADNGTKFEYI